MKAALALLVVLLIVLGAVPIAMGASAVGASAMGASAMGWCSECIFPAGMALGAMCLAILGLFVLVVPGASSVLARRPLMLRLRLFASSRDRPPRVP